VVNVTGWSQGLEVSGGGRRVACRSGAAATPCGQDRPDERAVAGAGLAADLGARPGPGAGRTGISSPTGRPRCASSPAGNDRTPERS
jgi:hypothetical protein